MIWLFCSANHLQAQEDAHYSQYMFNGLYVNPAYTGSRGVFSSVGLYRHQWVGVDNAPRSANIAAHAPIGSGLFSLGAHVNNDRLGVMIMNSAFMTMALRFKLAEGDNASRFAIGVQGGFKHYNINNQEVNNTLPVNDPVFSTNYSGFGFNGGWGMYLDAPNYFIGVSMPYMLNNILNYAAGSGAVKTNFEIGKTPIVASAGLVIKAGKDIKIKPSALFKYQGSLPPSFDLTIGIHVKEIFFIAASYRAENTLAGIAAINITQGLRVGYSLSLIHI